MVTRNSDTDYYFDRLVHAPLSDLSNSGIARLWVKKLGKSKEEIETAIAKVGDNAETVMKELSIQS